MDGKLVPLKAPISASGTLEIFDGMTLDPAHVVIPWDPTKGKLSYMKRGVRCVQSELNTAVSFTLPNISDLTVSKNLNKKTFCM